MVAKYLSSQTPLQSQCGIVWTTSPQLSGYQKLSFHFQLVKNHEGDYAENFWTVTIITFVKIPLSTLHLHQIVYAFTVTKMRMLTMTDIAKS